MKPFVVKGATDQTVYVFVPDSSSTTGAGLTGLVYNAASLVASYVRPLGARVAITLATQTVTGAHSDGGFVEIDATNMPGIYRLDLPDAVVASGVNSVVVHLKGAADMAPVSLEIPLTAVSLQDAVRFGLTALPNAAADAAGGLIISDAGGLDADAQKADVAAILVDTGTTLQGELDGIQADTEDIQGRLPATLVSGRIDASVGAMAANVMTAAAAASDLTTELQNGLATAASLATAQTDLDTLTGTDGVTLATAQALYAPSKAGDAMALTSGERTTLAAVIWDALTSGMSTVGSIGKKLADWSIHSAADVWSSATRLLTAGTNIALAKGTGVTGFTDLSAGDVRTAVGLASANLDTQLAAIDDAIDTEVSALVTAVDDLPTNAELATALGTADDAVLAQVALVKAKTDLIPAAPAAVGDIPTAAQNATAVLTTAMTESYSTDGGTKTLAQALYELFGLVGEFSVSGTTLTVKKLDGTTSAMTFTLDSASAPTSVTRAT